MAVQQATAEKWLKVTGCPIVEGYGLSETSPVATCNRLDSQEFTGTIGLPIPSTDIVIRDDDGQMSSWASPVRSASAARKSWPATGTGPTKPRRS